jgi:Fe-S-cluster-containing dehydrogenase component/DMSO reductase anchor subunit
MPAAPSAERTLIDEFLEEQRRLSAVERFAEWNEARTDNDRDRRYQHLIPLSAPRPGEQYAFAVDLDKCSGCKACVCACHSLNGLDDNELWRATGLLVGTRTERERYFGTPGPVTPRREQENTVAPYLQTITSACHHCVDPACLNGCPVLAYEKDPATGIVRHLDDQCIGCQYCVLKCPYDVPKFSPAKGIVRKCDLCHDRLEVGEPPACVQACPHEAIRITLVRQTDLVDQFRSPEIEPARADRRVKTFLAGTPDPAITVPTTLYQSSRGIPDEARAADACALRLEPAHWPLVIMLVCTQLSVGIHLLIPGLLLNGAAAPLSQLAATGFAWLILGLAASVAHLGRPLKAWRAFLGWRRSWMSREILAFGVYLPAAAALVLQPRNFILAGLAALAGAIAVGCSAMIYVDTRRPAWTARRVFGRFIGTVLRLGTASSAAWAAWRASALFHPIATLALVVGAVGFALECIAWLQDSRHRNSPFRLAHETLLQLLRPVLVARVLLFAGTTLFFAASLGTVGATRTACAAIAVSMAIASAVLERYTFFAACPTPRMPGGIVAR